VHDHVERSDRGDGRRHHVLRRRRRREVGRDRRMPFSRQLRHQRVEPLAPPPGDHDGGAPPGQHGRRGGPDARRGAGQQDGGTGEG
jgi:hypothetical protein